MRRDKFERIAGTGGAVLLVTGASYLWRLPQAWGPRAVLAVYSVSASLLLGGAFVIFRRVVRRAYEREGQLTSVSFFLQIAIWGIYFAFPCIYNPFDWAWSSQGGQDAVVLWAAGWACVGFGLVVSVIAMAWLGWPRSSGQGSQKLEVSGPYRVTRNPQLMGGLLLITGYVVLWPSWYAVGWLVLYPAMVHMMVLTEEGYLRALHGEAYQQYCRRVPRYLGVPRRE